MKVAEMSVEKLRNLIKEAIREEKEELLDVKRRILRSIQSWRITYMWENIASDETSVPVPLCP